MPIDSDRYLFNDDNISKAPLSGGVYQLEENNEITYIGRAIGNTTTIRSRLQDHKSGRDGPCTQSATHYRREINTNAAIKEQQLLDEYYRQHGRLPRCNDVMP